MGISRFWEQERRIVRPFNATKSYRKPLQIAERRQLFGIAEHYEKTAHQVLGREDPIIAKSRKGDFLRFMRNAGGGGGHQLKVKNFRIKATLCEVKSWNDRVSLNKLVGLLLKTLTHISKNLYFMRQPFLISPDYSNFFFIITSKLAWFGFSWVKQVLGICL